MSNQKIGQNSAQRMTKKYRIIAHLIVVIILILLMYVFNNLIKWQAQFITPDWSKILPILNISLGFNVLAHLIFILYDGKIFQSAVHIIRDIFSIAVMYWLFTIYPFKFEFFFGQAWLNPGFKIILVFAIGGTILAILNRLLNKKIKKLMSRKPASYGS